MVISHPSHPSTSKCELAHLVPRCTHPYLGEKMPIGLLPYIQATLLARYLRGEIDDYPAFLMT